MHKGPHNGHYGPAHTHTHKHKCIYVHMYVHTSNQIYVCMYIHTYECEYPCLGNLSEFCILIKNIQCKHKLFFILKTIFIYMYVCTVNQC